MSNNTPSDMQKVKIMTEKREDLYYPKRVARRIENGDWQRWMRMIVNIPKPRAIYRDITSASFALSIESILSAIAVNPSWTGLPIWVSIVYVVVGIVTLAVAFTSLHFVREVENLASHSVEEVLQDMNEVYKRSVRSEETTISTMTT